MDGNRRRVAFRRSITIRATCYVSCTIQSPNLKKELFLMKKAELLNGLREEYRQWEVLLDEIGPARMDQPGVAGDWSIKDIVAHLTGWRRRTVARLQATQRSEPEPPPP